MAVLQTPAPCAARAQDAYGLGESQKALDAATLCLNEGLEPIAIPPSRRAATLAQRWAGRTHCGLAGFGNKRLSQQRNRWPSLARPCVLRRLALTPPRRLFQRLTCAWSTPALVGMCAEALRGHAQGRAQSATGQLGEISHILKQTRVHYKRSTCSGRPTPFHMCKMLCDEFDPPTTFFQRWMHSTSPSGAAIVVMAMSTRQLNDMRLMGCAEARTSSPRW